VISLSQLLSLPWTEQFEYWKTEMAHWEYFKMHIEETKKNYPNNNMEWLSVPTSKHFKDLKDLKVKYLLKYPREDDGKLLQMNEFIKLELSEQIGFIMRENRRWCDLQEHYDKVYAWQPGLLKWLKHRLEERNEALTRLAKVWYAKNGDKVRQNFPVGMKQLKAYSSGASL